MKKANYYLKTSLWPLQFLILTGANFKSSHFVSDKPKEDFLVYALNIFKVNIKNTRTMLLMSFWHQNNVILASSVHLLEQISLIVIWCFHCWLSLSLWCLNLGSFHVKSSDNPGKLNLPSQEWLKFGVQVLSNVLKDCTKFYFIRTISCI